MSVRRLRDKPALGSSGVSPVVQRNEVEIGDLDRRPKLEAEGGRSARLLHQKEGKTTEEENLRSNWRSERLYNPENHRRRIIRTGRALFTSRSSSSCSSFNEEV